MRWQQLTEEQKREMVHQRKHKLPRTHALGQCSPRHAPDKPTGERRCGAIVEHPVHVTMNENGKAHA